MPNGKSRFRIWLAIFWLVQTLSCIGVIGAPLARGETRFIPSLGFSERYDSNILFAPSGSASERKQWDVVTTVTPAVQVIDKGREVETTLNVGGSGNIFVNNPKLNFFSAQVSGSVKLDGLVGQLLPGLKLRVSDSFMFTPEAPNFVAAGTPSLTENVFSRGIQTVRANTYTNATSIAASYPLSASFSIHGDYLYSLFRVGQIIFEQAANVPVVFFNSNFQRWSVGPSYQLTHESQVSLNFQTTNLDITEKSINLSRQPISQSTTARGVEAEYSTVAKYWSATASGGVTWLEQDGSAFFSGKLTASREIDKSTRLSLNLSRQLAPAFFATGGALISTAVSATVDCRLGDSFSVTGSANYALNESTPAEVARFESYSGIAIINYTGWRDLTPALSYQHNRFEAGGNGFGFVVNRSAAILSITARWK